MRHLLKCLFIAQLISACVTKPSIVFYVPSNTVDAGSALTPIALPTREPTSSPKASLTLTLVSSLHQSPHPQTFTPSATSPLIPTPGTETPKPSFCSDIRFSTKPNASVAQQVFPSGTNQIFAMWDYANMREGLDFRAEWSYFDPQTGKAALIQVREEKWDYSRYGATGTISDEALSYFDDGLEPGWYSLSLYIEGKQSWNSQCPYNIEFVVVETADIKPLESPDGTLLAIVEKPGVLIIQGPSGKHRELIVTDEISSLAWFPDGRHLVYSERDRTGQIMHAGTAGIREALWVIDIQTGEKNLVGTADEVLHTPHISPSGRYIALLTGTNWFDACFVDLSVVVIEMNGKLDRIGTFDLSDFTGLPKGSEDTSIYPIDLEDIPIPGRWQSSNQLIVGLGWTCMPSDPDGIYLLDLASLNAERVDDLKGE